MKRALTSAIALLFCICLSAAQAQTTTPPAKKPLKKSVQAKPPTPAKATVAGPVKKDGTPDKRYKANKTPAKTAGPLKKDGTPDMRYKANKTAAKPAGPTKKDGTPDMRYKANKPVPKPTPKTGA
jgi:hypothetical protein